MRTWLTVALAALSIPVLIATIFFLTQEQAEPPRRSAATDVRAIDGDTLEIGGERVRLHGFDAPELGQKCGSTCEPCGENARQALSSLVAGARVECLPVGERSYGRTVARCTAIGAYPEGGDVQLGLEMVRLGHGLPVWRFVDDPAERFWYEKALAQAREHTWGMHAGEFVEPWRWRRGQRLKCER